MKPGIAPAVDLENLTPDVLKLAYRKAKVDLYYSNDARASDLVEYERGFEDRISDLFGRLTGALAGGSASWMKRSKFVGGFSLIAKGFSDTSRMGEGAARFGEIHADGKEHIELDGSVEFRVLSNCSIDLHVVAALWLGTVGARLEAALGFAPRLSDSSDRNTDAFSSSFGDRLRRNQTNDYNWFSPGSYKPYMHQYRRWQEQGFRSMTAALERQDAAVAITADFSAFFPSLSSAFLLDPVFLEEECKVLLTARERKLTELLVVALEAWQRRARRDLASLAEIEEIPVGLPIGLPASGLIANLALARFDRTVRGQLNPLYYGRYVDDLLIVLRGSPEMKTGAEVWKWIERRFDLVSETRLSVEVDPDTRHVMDIEYELGYPDVRPLKLAQKKTRCYFLEGDSGKLLVESLRRTARDRTSEWRSLPEIPRDPADVPATIIGAVGADGDAAEALRLVHALTTPLARFALRLRDYEALAKDLPDAAWTRHRTAFFRTVADHVFAVPMLFDMERFLPRLVQLAVLSSDWRGLELQLEALMKSYAALKHSSKVVVKINGVEVPRTSLQDILAQWFDRLQGAIAEIAARASVRKVPEKTLTHLGQVGFSGEFITRLRRGHDDYAAFFLSDLAAVPFRATLLPHEWRQRAVPNWNKASKRGKRINAPTQIKPLLQEIAEFVARGASAGSAVQTDPAAETVSRRLARRLNRATGFVFPTRPMSASELLMVTRILGADLEVREPADPSFENNGSSCWGDFANAMLVMRGYGLESPEEAVGPERADGEDPSTIIRMPKSPDEDLAEDVKVALASILTGREQLAAAIHGTPELTLNRYQNLCWLANTVIKGNERADIFICPELSIPREWFSRFSFKLQTVGTSLIAGVEYGQEKDAPTNVRNQIWANFVHRAWGFPSSVFYSQDKQRPARGEERNLLAEHRATLKPERSWTMPPILEFRGMFLSLLVCSEVTNLEYRAFLRAKIDALFAVEWNQDVKTFSSIVESAAYDMHAFVIQANNRAHGDTRIRAPYRDEWRRDIVKVSGGSHDHVIVGRIDFHSLRRFQSSHDRQGDQFKSLPDGYEIAPHRDHWIAGRAPE